MDNFFWGGGEQWDFWFHSVHITSKFASLTYTLIMREFCLLIITHFQYMLKLVFKVSDFEAFESTYLNSYSVCFSSFSFRVTQRHMNNMGFEVLMVMRININIVVFWIVMTFGVNICDRISYPAPHPRSIYSTI